LIPFEHCFQPYEDILIEETNLLKNLSILQHKKTVTHLENEDNAPESAFLLSSHGLDSADIIETTRDKESGDKEHLSNEQLSR